MFQKVLVGDGTPTIILGCGLFCGKSYHAAGGGTPRKERNSFPLCGGNFRYAKRGSQESSTSTEAFDKQLGNRRPKGGKRMALQKRALKWINV